MVAERLVRDLKTLFGDDARKGLDDLRESPGTVAEAAETGDGAYIGVDMFITSGEEGREGILRAASEVFDRGIGG